ncbi:MAG TPA: hypothetical protein DCF45_06195, partial [Gammaproteobacteria bacterium]|nr:hypothetical protein [Gammaproteobacteria bacterium]
MSWLKKIGKKGKDKSDSNQSGVTDETVLFGGDEPFQPDSPSSRSSMISELAGLDPESSADLSGELSSSSADQPSLIDQYLQDDPAEQSGEISLDFEDDSGQQQTAVFNADDLSAEPPDFDVSSDQQHTAIFEEPPSSTSDSPGAFAAGAVPTPDTSPPPKGSPPPSVREMPNLEFDSEPEISTSGSRAPDISDVPAPLGKDFLAGESLSSPQPDTPQREGSGSSAALDEFDLDLSEDFPAVEDNRAIESEMAEETVSAIDVTGEQAAAETINPEQSIDYQQLATVKLDQPVPSPVAAKTEPLVEKRPEPVFDGDATVITTTNGAPANALDAHFVVGWVIVVDGPGKGHSLPIRSGINSIG